MNKYVLDASALLALFNEEPGAEKVAQILPYSVMSMINASEVIAELANKLAILPTEGRYMVDTCINELITFDLEQATEVAHLRKYTAHLGLSLGDRACISLGMRLKAPIYTADKIWIKLGKEYPIVLIR